MEVHRKDEFSALIFAKGSVDLSTSHLLKEKLQMLCEEGRIFVTLDFDRVNSIDSSGLGKLLLFHKKLKACGGELKIVHITSSHVRNIFDMIHLHKVIKIENELEHN